MDTNLRNIDEIPKFIHGGHYSVTVDWDYIESWIEDEQCHNIELDPDFQRAHVWTQDKQIRYVEFSHETITERFLSCPRKSLLAYTPEFEQPFLEKSTRVFWKAQTPSSIGQTKIPQRNLSADI